MSKRRNRNRPNATGRNPHTRFVRLDYRLLNSLAYRSLATNARALLIELAMLYNGENNGSIYLALKSAAARIGVADAHTAARAFDELEESGFITMTRAGHFRVKASEQSRARAWRLNHIPGPGRRVADWEFLDRQPPAGTRANKRADSGCRALKAYRKARDAEKFAGVEFSHSEAELDEAEAGAVRNFHTAATENGGFAGRVSVGNFHTNIANQGGAGTTQANITPESMDGPNSASLGWWRPDYSLPLARLAYTASFARQLGEAVGNRKLAA